MKNILLIIQREYLSRVKKKSFIIMTLLGPLLIALLYGGMIYMMISDGDLKKVEVIDESSLFANKFENTSELEFNYSAEALETRKNNFKEDGSDVLVYIPKEVVENGKGVKVYSETGLALDLETKIRRTIEREIESIKLGKAGISEEVLKEAKVRIDLETISIKEGEEKKNNSGISSGVGMFMALLIYMAVLVYGTQVMKGVNEEKTSRIVEVIISSVKPFQLLLGKILGIALVGLTQFLLWIILSGVVMGVGGSLMSDTLIKNKDKIVENQMKDMPEEVKAEFSKGLGNQNLNKITEMTGDLQSLPLGTLAVSFLLYFIGGYLLYSSLFGAVGAAVDSEAETQQFMLPLTMPIIVSIVIAQTVIFKDPHSSLAFWGSMIPFTSPVVMMARIPFGVPVWEIALSIALLILGFIFTVWLASRIYRVGILMYGKKVSYKELAKWIFYKG